MQTVGRLLKLYFYLRKSTAEVRLLLVQAYGDTNLTQGSRREWSHKFENSEFDVDVIERSRMPKVDKDMDLEALLKEDSWHTQEELALTL